jgi:hypothetical protein
MTVKNIEEENLVIGGDVPAIGSLVRVSTRYGVLDGTVESALNRLKGRWVACVKPLKYPETMQPNALWEINSLDVPWLMLKVGEGPVIEVTKDNDLPTLPDDCIEDVESSSLDTVKSLDDLVKTLAKEGDAILMKPRSIGATSMATQQNKEQVIIDAIKKIGVASKSEVIALTKISEIDWNLIIALLVEQNKVIKTGAKRGTKYQAL